MSKSIKWLIEDEVVALYLEMYGDSGLEQSQGDVIQLMENTVISKKRFDMRMDNFRHIITKGNQEGHVLNIHYLLSQLFSNLS